MIMFGHLSKDILIIKITSWHCDFMFFISYYGVVYVFCGKEIVTTSF
jgi:hypothetical protein